MNLPNSITLARIACVPLLLWTLASATLSAPAGRRELLAIAIFLLASATDGVDGLLARRRQQITALGMLLSPLADKLLLSTAYIALASLSPELMPAWAAVLLVGREFLILGLASVALQEKMKLRVREIGKLKTVAQACTVTAVLLAHAWPGWSFVLGASAGRPLVVTALALASMMVGLMLAVSLIPAIIYFRSFWFEAQQQKPRAQKVLPFAAGGRGPGSQGKSSAQAH